MYSALALTLALALLPAHKLAVALAHIAFKSFMHSYCKMMMTMMRTMMMMAMKHGALALARALALPT